MLEKLAARCDSRMIKSHPTLRLKTVEEELRKTHALAESAATFGKIGLGIEDERTEEAFT